MFDKKKKTNTVNNGLSLSQLDIFPEGFGSEEEAMERLRKSEVEQEEYKAKYGKDWLDYYDRDHGIIHESDDDFDYDRALKLMNDGIFNAYYPRIASYSIPGGPDDWMNRVRCGMPKRLMEIYGDRYMELAFHKPNDPRVNELLIQDALKTGKWKELPDCLQAEYHRRAGDGL